MRRLLESRAGMAALAGVIAVLSVARWSEEQRLSKFAANGGESCTARSSTIDKGLKQWGTAR